MAPVAETLKTPDWVEPADGDVKATVGTPFFISTERVTVGLTLPVESIA